MRILTLAPLALLAVALPGCTSKETKCITSCDPEYSAQRAACKASNSPDKCAEDALRARWACRKACGLVEPEPPRVASDAKPTPPRQPASVPYDRELYKVCNGTPQPLAPAYDRAKGKHHPAVVASKGTDGKEFLVESIAPAYKPLGVPNAAPLMKVDAYPLVVCVTTKEHKKAKDCAFPKQHVLELHDATYQIRVLEAKTAKVLADETKALKSDGRCPSVYGFTGEREVSLESPQDAVLKIAKKYVDP